jgi:hypothetical protein
MKTLQERFADWVEWDGASFEMGAHLGLWPEWDSKDPWGEVKGIIWSSNPLGDGIANFLEALVKAEVLERREEPDTAFRWNKSFSSQPSQDTCSKCQGRCLPQNHAGWDPTQEGHG